MSDELILLVEDNPDDADLTIDAFRRSGIVTEVVVARDGVEALERVHGARGGFAVGVPRLPSLMILDLNLPRIGGLDVLRRVRAHERTRRLPVVVLTTSVDDRDVAESYRLGANAYVRKPVAFDDFVEAAGHMARFWLHVNVRPPAQG